MNKEEKIYTKKARKAINKKLTTFESLYFFILIEGSFFYLLFEKMIFFIQVLHILTKSVHSPDTISFGLPGIQPAKIYPKVN